MPEDGQRGVWRKRESRNSGPESRWPAGDLGREAQVFKVKKIVVFFVLFCFVLISHEIRCVSLPVSFFFFRSSFDYSRSFAI